MTKAILRIAASLSLVTFVSQISAQSMFDKINDFDGDGRADFAVTRSEGGLKIWHIWQTTTGHRQLHWGLDTDINAAGHYDFDSKSDIGIVRRVFTPPSETTCNFHVRYSMDSTHLIVRMPLSLAIESSCTPMQQDYDGDGRTDPANWASQVTGFFNFRQSSSGGTVSVELGSGQVPVLIGDTDGNLASEITTYLEQVPRQVRRRNASNGTFTTVQFGVSGDIYVPADFDGDNIGELAVFRPTTGDWWWIRSSDGTVGVEHWGINGDVPVPADYDGDGKTDRAVYRSGSPNGIYYINGSLTGFQAFGWGVPGDQVVRYQR